MMGASDPALARMGPLVILVPAACVLEGEGKMASNESVDTVVVGSNLAVL
jgi:hypothetical protein